MQKTVAEVQKHDIFHILHLGRLANGGGIAPPAPSGYATVSNCNYLKSKSNRLRRFVIPQINIAVLD